MSAHRAAERARLQSRIETLEGRAAAASADKKWTAASALEDQVGKLLDRVLQIDAEAAELAAQEEEDLDPASLLDDIAAVARELPSYMLDDLIDRLEELRR